MTRHLLLGAAVLLSLPGHAAAQTTATVTGRVTSAATGQPVSGVELTIIGLNAATAVTDANGGYVFSVSAGTYTLHTSNSKQLVDETYGGEQCPAIGCGNGRSFAVTTGQSLQADFALEPGVHISGRIIDAATGQPLVLNVSLFDAQRRWIRTVSGTVSGTYSTASQNSGLPAGTYFAAVMIDRYSGHVSQMYAGINCTIECRLEDAAPIRLAAQQSAGGIDFALQPFGTVTGRVTDAATGQGLAGVVVQVSELTKGQAFSGTTDVTGTFVIPSVMPGVYGAYTYQPVSGYAPKIYPNAPGLPCASGSVASYNACRDNLRASPQIVVGSGSTVTGINFALDPSGSISGTITLGGQPMTTIPGGVKLYDFAGRAVASSFTNTSATYTISGLPAGTYFAFGGAEIGHQYAYGAPGCRSNTCVTAGTLINVGTSPVTGIDFALPVATATIAGTLRNQNGTALSSGSVSLFGDDGRVQPAGVDANGAFAFTQLEAGTYRLRGASNGFVTEWYDNGCDACGERGIPVVVAAGQVRTGIDFALNAAGQIKGRLSPGPFGQFLIVDALRADGSVVASAAAFDEYTIDGLPPGNYYVRAWSQPVFSHGFGSGGNYSPQLYDHVDCDSVDCPLTSATTVTVTAGAAVTGVDFTVTRGASISGRIRSEGSVFLPGSGPPRPDTQFATVQAFTADGRLAGNENTLNSPSGPSGEYRIVGLQPGTYYLRAFAYGYPTQIYRDLICATCPPQRGTPVTVTAQQERTGIDFLLLTGGTISGSVRDAASGNGIDGITVNAYGTDGTIVAASTTTVSNGAFVIDGLASGGYFLSTSNAAGYADKIYEATACEFCVPRGTLVSVQSGQTSSGIEIVLARGGIVSGRVIGPQGSDAQATVSLFNATGAMVAQVPTSNGSYVASVPAGTTFVRARGKDGLGTMRYDNVACTDAACDPAGGTPIVVSEGSRSTQVDFSLPVCGQTLFTTTGLPNAFINAPYLSTISAVGAGPYSFTVASGSLPVGVSLATSGAVSGTPSQVGRYSVTVAATNANGCGASRAYLLDVTACHVQLSPVSVDIGGAGGEILAFPTSSCGWDSAINVPWISVTDFRAGTAHFFIAGNPGGRRTGSVRFGDSTLVVNQGAAVSQAPFGTIDTPADGAVVSGSIAVSGWALDDLRVKKVDIYRNPAGKEGTAPVFLGAAVLVPGARPDVERLFGDLPSANRAGWGYLLLTNMLPDQGNGVFTLIAIAEDAEGHQVTLGTRTITASNATATTPFGAIDTPAQGETIFGAAYTNFGWALTPKPKTIPLNGATIRVLIDGADAGAVDYNHFRPDVAGLFPGLNNSSGPVGFRTIDTTTLADGIHTIAWIVTDDAGAAEGIGSRYFTVANAGGVPQSVTTTAAITSGLRTIKISPLQGLSLDLTDGDSTCRETTFTGGERVGGELRPLPIGSSLDSGTGRFNWQPGPAFGGAYRLSFISNGCGHEKRIEIEVVIADPEK